MYFFYSIFSWFKKYAHKYTTFKKVIKKSTWNMVPKMANL
jgi:hypothetical protein